MKVILIEDRIHRQSNFLNDSNVSRDIFKNNCDYLTTPNGEEYNEIKENFENGKYEILQNFNCIIVHRSAFTKNILNGIYENCKMSGSHLVFFSGGISSTTLSEDSRFSFLTINSKNLYSTNLELFLNEIKESKNIDLGILAFGKNFEMNIFLSLLQRMSLVDELMLLGSECLVEELIEKYQIENRMLKSLLEKRFEWFQISSQVPILTSESVHAIKQFLLDYIHKKVRYND